MSYAIVLMVGMVMGAAIVLIFSYLINLEKGDDEDKKL